jgi:hypothetical protein
MIHSYLDFLLRQLPTHSVVTGSETIKNFPAEILFWTIFFTVAFYLIELIGRTTFSLWYNNLTPRKRKEFPAYLACLIHHAVLVPRAWKMIYDDTMRDESALAIVSYPTEGGILAPFCLGYLLSDTICYALPELFSVGNPEYILHHALISWLVTASMFSNGHLLRFIPHLLICDTTNLCFNTAWILRTMNERIRNSFFVIFLEISFSLFFLFVRVINLPLTFYAIVKSDYGYELGTVRWTFIPIILLQWFWFLKVLNGMISRLFPTIDKNKSKRLLIKPAETGLAIGSEDALEKVVKEKKII